MTPAPTAAPLPWVRTQRAAPAAGGDLAAVWLALTAPGALLAVAIPVLALMAAPSTGRLYVASNVRLAAAILLLVHGAATFWAVWHMHRAATVAFQASLAVGASACGLVAGADGQWLGPAVPMLGVVLAMGMITAGWSAMMVSGCGAALAIGGAMWLQLSRPIVAFPARSLSPVLSTETTFAGAPVIAPAVTTLSVETAYGADLSGVSAFDARATAQPQSVASPRREVFVTALGIALLGTAVGNALSVLRVRRAAATLGAAHAAARAV